MQGLTRAAQGLNSSCMASAMLVGATLVEPAASAKLAPRRSGVPARE
jgi:hypothetical protein